tara:strand:+ start:9001 stop:9690 length:690 start_codon:yes stop_codon:yes gene_type:complete
MSYVDSQKKICFTHIAKNGGRSVSNYLLELCGPSDHFIDQRHRGWWFQGSGHSTYHLAKNNYDENKTWFAFAHIRNPIDRVYSAWKGYEMYGHVITFPRFLDYIENLKENSPLWNEKEWAHNPHDIRDMPEIYADPVAVNAHIAPQCFYFDKSDNIKLYSFNNLFGFVDDLPDQEWRRAAKTTTKPHVKDHDYEKPTHEESIVDQIKRIYAKDFEIYEEIETNEKANML